MEPCARGHACDVSMEDGDNTCIVEPSNYESKRKNFHAIIQTLKEEITSLTDALKLIEKERFDFTLRIFKLQLRVHFLRSELDRVGSHKGNKVTSNVIHNGVVQMMERKELLVKLELELESTRSSIAELTKTIISGCKEKGKLSSLRLNSCSFSSGSSKAAYRRKVVPTQRIQSSETVAMLKYWSIDPYS